MISILKLGVKPIRPKRLRYPDIRINIHALQWLEQLLGRLPKLTEIIASAKLTNMIKFYDDSSINIKTKQG